MIIEASSIINCSASDVWKYVGDTSSWPKWAPVYLELNQTSQGQIAIGAAFHSKHPRNRTLDERLIEYEPFRRFTFEFTSGPIKGSRETYSLAEVVDGTGSVTTKLTRSFDLKFSGLFKVLGPLLVTPGFKKEKRVEVENVKRLLEEGKPGTPSAP